MEVLLDAAVEDPVVVAPQDTQSSSAPEGAVVGLAIPHSRNAPLSFPASSHIRPSRPATGPRATTSNSHRWPEYSARATLPLPCHLFPSRRGSVNLFPPIMSFSLSLLLQTFAVNSRIKSLVPCCCCWDSFDEALLPFQGALLISNKCNNKKSCLIWDFVFLYSQMPSYCLGS